MKCKKDKNFGICCDQQSARLQMIRRWMDNTSCEHPYEALTLWDKFVSDRRRLFGDDPNDWFEDDA